MPSTDLYALRLLEPSTDAALYTEAYSWRQHPKHYIQPDRLPFEEFAADRDDHVTIGLFNGELQAVYFLHETEPGKFQCHFTSRRDVSRETLLVGAAQVAADFFAAGASELHAWVTERNAPLRSFLEALGFKCVGSETFPCQNDTGSGRLLSDDATSVRKFVKYVLMVNDHRNFRQEAD